jgi:hypothetical protein
VGRDNGAYLVATLEKFLGGGGGVFTFPLPPPPPPTPTIVSFGDEIQGMQWRLSNISKYCCTKSFIASGRYNKDLLDNQKVAGLVIWMNNQTQKGNEN